MVSPLAPLAFAGLAPPGRLARSAVLAASPRPQRTLGRLGEHLDTLAATFDGRLRVAAVDRGSGARVLFGAPGAPTASVRDAVLASCAVPWLFTPVTIGDREYVDGGVWSPINLDAAPGGRGADVLCLAPTAGAGPFDPVTERRARRRGDGAARPRHARADDRAGRGLDGRDGHRTSWTAEPRRGGPRARRFAQGRALGAPPTAR